MTAVEDVVSLPWPTHPDHVSDADRHRPRILLVDELADPPEIDDDLVDWVRLPADPRDIDARIRALARRASASRRRYTLDRFGRLHCGDRWVMIHSDVERRLLTRMLPHLGEVISFEDLFDAGWDGGTPTANALRVHITRMNRRIAPLGLAMTGVRLVGYVLEDTRFMAG